MKVPEHVVVDLSCGCRPALRVNLLGGGAASVVRIGVDREDVDVVARHLLEDHGDVVQRRLGITP